MPDRQFHSTSRHPSLVIRTSRVFAPPQITGTRPPGKPPGRNQITPSRNRRSPNPSPRKGRRLPAARMTCRRAGGQSKTRRAAPVGLPTRLYLPPFMNLAGCVCTSLCSCHVLSDFCTDWTVSYACRPCWGEWDGARAADTACLNRTRIKSNGLHGLFCSGTCNVSQRGGRWFQL